MDEKGTVLPGPALLLREGKPSGNGISQTLIGMVLPASRSAAAALFKRCPLQGDSARQSALCYCGAIPCRQSALRSHSNAINMHSSPCRVGHWGLIVARQFGITGHFAPRQTHRIRCFLPGSRHRLHVPVCRDVQSAVGCQWCAWARSSSCKRPRTMPRWGFFSAQ